MVGKRGVEGEKRPYMSRREGQAHNENSLRCGVRMVLRCNPTVVSTVCSV